jgi:RNA polymerase sigma-70 factor, ECF subfamily
MASQPLEASSPESKAPRRFSAAVERAFRRCWEKAAAPAEWGMSPEAFREALLASIDCRFKEARPSDGQVEAYLEGLHATDLTLALACRMGSEAAWEFFFARYRTGLYSAARAIVHSGGRASLSAEELADSLYADLYGLREGAGVRKSLFKYFHGRSALSTWLRAVLAQRYVDEIRRARKLQPINDGADDNLKVPGATPIVAANAHQHVSVDPASEMYLVSLQTAMKAALDGLEPRDRLRLAYYYADGRTLAEIGRLLGEHEATVSRKLDHTRRELHESVRSDLREHKKMSGAQVEECLEYARKEWPFDLTEQLRSGGTRQDL